MAWLAISSGRGPEECQVFVSKFVEWLKGKHDIHVISVEESRHGLLSATISGDESVLNKYCGNLKWISQSKIRPNHKRKNWFITARLLSEVIPEAFDEKQVTYETARSSGPGGQHVNKTESAVRAIYKPLNISVFAQEERSQHQNKKLALARLIERVREHNQIQSDKAESDKWNIHNTLERGNADIVFSSRDF